MKTSAAILAIVAAASLGSSGPAAQQLSRLAVGFGQFQHTVLDNDRSDFFYADAVGMTIRAVPGNPYGSLPAEGALTDTSPRSRLIRSGGRFGTQGAAGSLSMEFVRFTNVETTPGGARVQDPGNAILLLTVADVAATVDNARRAGGAVVADQPMLAPAAGGNSTMIRDPDGFLIHVAGGATPSARVGLVVEDIDRAATFYRNLGLEVAPTTALTASGARLREMTMNGLNAPVQVVLLEFQGVDRRPFHKRLTDYGTPAMAMTVRDCDAAVEVVRRSGGSVYSAGGGCVHETQANGMPFNRVFVRDADGFLLEFLQRGNPTP